MRYFFIVIAVTILTVFCFAKAQAQYVDLFGASLSTDTSKTAGQIRATAYTGADTTIPVFMTNGTIKQIPISRINTPLVDTSLYLKKTDTIRSGIVTTYFYVDSLVGTVGGGTTDTPTIAYRLLLEGQSNMPGNAVDSELTDTPMNRLQYNFSDTFRRVWVRTKYAKYEPLVIGYNNSTPLLVDWFGPIVPIAQRWMEETTQGNLFIDMKFLNGDVIQSFQKGTAYYDNLIEKRDSANVWLTSQGYTPVELGWLWMQGESDMSNDSAYYRSALDSIVSLRIADGLLSAGTRLVISGIPTGSAMYGAGVRAAMEGFVADNFRARFLENVDSFLGPDTIHYSTFGTLQVGYNAYQKLFDANIKNVVTRTDLLVNGNGCIECDSTGIPDLVTFTNLNAGATRLLVVGNHLLPSANNYPWIGIKRVDLVNVNNNWMVVTGITNNSVFHTVYSNGLSSKNVIFNFENTTTGVSTSILTIDTGGLRMNKLQAYSSGARTYLVKQGSNAYMRTMTGIPVADIVGFSDSTANKLTKNGDSPASALVSGTNNNQPYYLETFDTTRIKILANGNFYIGATGIDSSRLLTVNGKGYLHGATSTSTPNDAPWIVDAHENGYNLVCQTGGFSTLTGIYDGSSYKLTGGAGFTEFILATLDNKNIELAPHGTGKVVLRGIPEYADNAAAILGGLAVDEVYRTGDTLKIVH